MADDTKKQKAKKGTTSSDDASSTSNVGVFTNTSLSIITKAQQKSFDRSDSDMKEVLRSYNIVDRYDSDTNWTTRFARFGMLDPQNVMPQTREYLFFTRPDLYLVEPPGSSAPANWITDTSTYLTDTIARYPNIIDGLQLSNTSANLGTYPFSVLLSNALSPDSKLELPDLNADTHDGPSNVYGTKMFYRGTSMKSDEEVDFTLEFNDSKYLEVYTYFKMYDEYERCKWLGQVEYKDKSRWQKYAENRIMHDAISIYKFVVADDGMSLIYWARIVGVVPTSIPRSAFSDMSNTNEGQKISVGFKGHWVRDMDPRILVDFNKLNEKRSSSGDIPLIKNGHINGDWGYRAKIVSVDDSGSDHPKRKYYFTWQKK